MREFEVLKQNDPDNARLVELLYNRVKINDLLPSDALAAAFNLGATYSQVKHDKIFSEQAELDRQRSIDHDREQQLIAIVCALLPKYAGHAYPEMYNRAVCIVNDIVNLASGKIQITKAIIDETR